MRIYGINAVGEEDGNDLIIEGRDLPWLQDTESQAAWSRWDAEWRDVYVLDAENYPVGIVNLTLDDLSVPENYEALRQLILDAAP